MFPFVFLGKIIGLLYPLREEFDFFFFFPTYAIGGAERINAEIVKSFPDKKCVVFFTKKSPNEGMKHFFEDLGVTLKNVAPYTDNKWLFFMNLVYRGICSQYVNNQKQKPTIFIGHCNFGYKITPHISRKCKVVDLLHMYHDSFFWVWGPFVKFIDQRVVVGDVFVKKFESGMKKNGMPLKYLQNFRVIFYKLEYLPEEKTPKSRHENLLVYYAGRGGMQKRIWILVEIARKCYERKLPIEFKFAGPHKDELPPDVIDRGIYIGELKGGEEMYNFHKEGDILLMVSGLEGFPITIMEAMSFASVPIVTNIDAIPEHIQHGENGLLLYNVEDEAKLVDEAIDTIMNLHYNRTLLASLSENAFLYAKNHFTAQKFIDSYRNILLNK